MRRHRPEAVMPRSTEQLVDRQVQRWLAEARAAERKAPSPCIALSRLPGAGAAELGRALAQRLGYGFFGIELVDQIAREGHVAQRLVEGLDEHVRSAIERTVGDAFRRNAFVESDYLRALVHAISTIGERGGAVLLGRGAPFVLPAERALRVLVVAPEPVRAERVAAERGIDAAAAARALREEDSQRYAFLRHQFGVDPNDPVLYDLVVNTGTFDLEAAQHLVVTALERRFPPARA
jgi:cytidylate kinase